MSAPSNPTTTTHASLRTLPLPGRGLGTLAMAPIPRGARLVADAPVLAATGAELMNEELLAPRLAAAYASLPAEQRRRIGALAAHPEAVARWTKIFEDDAAMAAADASWASGGSSSDESKKAAAETSFGSASSSSFWSVLSSPAASAASAADTATVATATAAATLDVAERAHLMAAWNTNCFGVGRGESGQGWAAVVAPSAARLNHSCVPNAVFTWNDAVGAITVHAIRDVEEGEEVTIAYVDVVASGKHRRESLEERYGFVCDCAACTGGDEEALDRMRKRIKLLRVDLEYQAKREPENRNAKVVREAVEEGVMLLERTGLVGVHLAIFYEAAFAATGDRKYQEEELRVSTYCFGNDHPRIKEIMEKMADVEHLA